MLERSLVEVVRAAGVVGRTVVRSFDHRCVRVLRRLEPELTGAVLIAGTAPSNPRNWPGGRRTDLLSGDGVPG